ncbi:UDP-glucose/GDP-mannose dehydrogenase family protein [Cocleimonas sp. KMM 6892]|uniref:UDP-glucose dehydrogenase family protein n=1 Tax=unclassified Cocleimonas TaxID=2639732 RepID=UPI002DBE1D4D|nr:MULTISPECIES: UDP-glucose/GDP-mannose dehydrogenase family protein [unclassified Cocleimonas]MEB8432365.1 UDP-glucose/GDP-mannose dehydrogenase family protein [Cocleimonas sp. KMM 6892]MEC4715224.1 UDP-glucose/GDP-mannose dehydrogenase family protein [Cocleimonas sp. KMM 6895]MEC4745157.1 UDP-glucose/GDP-mannose dehydrogenase family protein [Cocleimonas sp. KMM 6896]
MKITIYGAGYVGLITGASMAQVGNDVLCVDIDEEKIKRLSKGKTSIHEPGLKKLLEENIKAGRLKFTTSAAEGAEHGLYLFIAVNVPSDDSGNCYTRHILTVAKSIADNMNGYRIIISKSTAPVGTSDKVKEIISNTLRERGEKHEFDMISNPEFLKTGVAIDDFMKPDRIIIGSDNPRTIELMRELFSPFNHNRDRIVAMDIRSAELTKYAANALLATKVSFMNELSNISEILGADIEQVRIGIGSDPRIGYHFIYPGCGYGGSRFPKDVRALAHCTEDQGYTAELLNAVEAVNYRQKEKLFEKLNKYYGESLKDKTIAIWGLSFKPDSADMRGAASRVLMRQLWNIGATVRAYDPAANKACKKLYGDKEALTICNTADEALEGADALVIPTEWQEFRSPDFNKIINTLNDPVIVDGRNLYKPDHMKDLGITYYGIGRGE